MEDEKQEKVDVVVVGMDIPNYMSLSKAIDYLA
jgi:hypothetical protein